MVRRATRSPGARPRTPRAATSTDPLLLLRALAEQRGAPGADDALDRWLSSMSTTPGLFEASADFLATRTETLFSTPERWFLLSILSEMYVDPVLTEAVDELEARLDDEERSWPGNDGQLMSEEALRDASPVYAALGDAMGALQHAISVSFLGNIGMADVARAMTNDDGVFSRLVRDGEATLLGVPRIVLGPDDDPFDILQA